MSATRKTALVAGILYLLTHVTSVVGLALYTPALDDPSFASGGGNAAPVLIGGFLEVVLALAVVGTSVALYPVVRRRSESGALAYVALRTLEAGVILLGVVPILALVSLRGSGAADLPGAAAALVALHDWAFLLGPGFVCGTNTVVLAAVLHRSGLVPRFIPVLGLIGGPLVFASNSGVMFGLYEQVSPFTAVGALPVFAWEVCLAVFLVVKGFRAEGLAASAPAPASVPA